MQFLGEVALEGDVVVCRCPVPKMRADNAALALKTLFPAPLDVEKFAHSYREKRASDVEVNDFVAIQLYPDLKTSSKLPDCNPGLPDGLGR